MTKTDEFTSDRQLSIESLRHKILMNAESREIRAGPSRTQEEKFAELLEDFLDENEDLPREVKKNVLDMLTDVRETISEEKTYHIKENTWEVSDYEQHNDTQLVPDKAGVSYIKENTHKEIVNIEKSYITEDISDELISGLADVRATDSHERADETTSDAETDVYSEDSDDEILNDLAEHTQGSTAHAATHVDPEVRDGDLAEHTQGSTAHAATHVDPEVRDGVLAEHTQGSTAHAATHVDPEVRDGDLAEHTQGSTADTAIHVDPEVRDGDLAEHNQRTTADAATHVDPEVRDGDLAEHNQGTTADAAIHVDPEVRDGDLAEHTQGTTADTAIHVDPEVRDGDLAEHNQRTTADAATHVDPEVRDGDLAEHNQGTTADAAIHVDPEVRDGKVLRETGEPNITYKQRVQENAKVTRANTDTDGYSDSKDDKIFSKIEVQRKDVLLGETRNRPVSRGFKRSADGELKQNAFTMDIKQSHINMQSFNKTEPKRRKYGSIMEVPTEMNNTGEKIYDEIAAFFGCKYLTFSFMNIHARLHSLLIITVYK